MTEVTTEMPTESVATEAHPASQASSNGPIWPDAKPGALVRVHEKLKETNAKGEEKERIQVFEGLVLARRGGNTAGATITVRKNSFGINVEKIYPLHSPVVAKIERVKQFKTRRAKLYFVRDNNKRMKEVKAAKK